MLAWFGNVEDQVDRIQPLFAKVEEVRLFFLQPLRLLGIISHAPRSLHED